MNGAGGTGSGGGCSEGASSASCASTSDKRDWKGTASELLAALDAVRGEGKPEPGWPKRAADLGRRLTVLQPALLDLGARVEPDTDGRGADKRRIWRLTWAQK